MESKREAKVKEESSIAFETFWSKGLAHYFQAFIDGSLVAPSQVHLWGLAKKDQAIAEAWCNRLTAEKETLGDRFPIEKEVLLGIIHYHWNKNYEKACLIFKRAAQEKNPTAQYYLGRIYEFNHGVSSGPAVGRALDNYVIAACGSNPSAMARTAIASRHQNTVPQINRVNYFQNALKLNDPMMAYRFGQFYQNECMLPPRHG